MLLDHEVAQLVERGFLRIDQAFSPEVAAACRAILLTMTGLRADDPTTWTKPVVRIEACAAPPFREAVASPRLHAAWDRLGGDAGPVGRRP